jgi:hypothetical protein
MGEDFDLKSVRLEQIDWDGYHFLTSEFWKSNIVKREDQVYARIFNPIKHTIYEDLIRALIDLEYADQIGVHEKGPDWFKRYVRLINDYDIRKMARIAASDRFKKNFLEIKLKEWSDEKEDTLPDRTTIGFVEYEKEIISAEMRVAFDHKDLFDFNHEADSFRYARGVWVPDNYEEIINKKWEK